MRLSYFIAARYFFSRRIKAVIHIIAIISAVGIMVCTAALIIILSGVNGFEEVVQSLYNSFDADIHIEAQNAKYFPLDEELLTKLAAMQGVSTVTPVIEENILLRYKDQQTVATMKAIQPQYMAASGLERVVRYGSPLLMQDSTPLAILGSGVAATLGLQLNDREHPIQIFLPNKGKISLINPARSFKMLRILGGEFSPFSRILISDTS